MYTYLLFVDAQVCAPFPKNFIVLYISACVSREGTWRQSGHKFTLLRKVNIKKKKWGSGVGEWNPEARAF